MDNSGDSEQSFWHDARIDGGPRDWMTGIGAPTPAAETVNDAGTAAANKASGQDQTGGSPIAAANPFGATINLASLGAFGIKITGASGAASGLGVAAAGDFNHDGIADFIIGGGGAHATNGGQSLGEEYVIFGKVGLASFTLSPGIAATAGFRIGGEDYPENAGTSFSFAGIGDINNDGFQDVMFGASAYNTNGLGNNNVGAAYVVFGKSTGIGAVQLGSNMGAIGFKITGVEVQGQIGTVSKAGDFNHDGIADFAVGGRFVDGNGADSGAVQIFFGKASGWADLTFGSTATPSITLVGATGDWLGGKISSAGDVNGDGIDDLIVNATHGATSPAYNSTPGYAYVVYGSASASGTLNVSTMSASQGFKITGDAAHKVLGVDVAGVGDVNGDGFADVAVSSGEYYGSEGRTYIVFGHGTGANITVGDSMASTVGFEIIGTGKQDAGWSISRAGDVNGDGLADIIIGAPTRADTTAPAAYVIFGKASGFTTINLSSLAAADGFKIVGASGSLAGFSVAGVGDVNGDHVDDLLVSAPSEQASYVIFGISTAPVNVAPVLDLDSTAAGTGSTVTLIENQSVKPAANATLTDSDSANFDTGTLTVTYGAGMTANDAFGVTDQGGQFAANRIGVSGTNIYYNTQIIGTVTSSGLGQPLVITFNANATPTAVQALLHEVLATNTSDTPPTAARNLTFTVTDGDGGSSSAVSSVTITPTNDAPTIANLQGDSVTVNEGFQTGVDLGSNAVITDVDSANFNGGSLHVQITTGLQASTDRILFVGNGIVSLSGQSAGATVFVKLASDPSPVAIGTLANDNLSRNDTTINFNSDNATPARVQELIRALQFNANSDAVVSGARTVSFTLVDGDGVANGGTDSSTYTTTVNVVAINDAPVNFVPGAQTTAEDTSRTFNVNNGNYIVISDVDAGSALVQVTVGVAHGGLTLSGVTGLTFSTGDGTADATMTFTGTLTNINNALNGLDYTPALNYNGTDTLTVTTNDLGNTGTGGQLTDTDTVSITISAVNDAPTGTDATIAVQHGVSHTLTLGDFGYSDIEGDTFVSVTIDTVPSVGRLLLADGSGARFAVTQGQLISAADIAAGRLIYKPTPGQNDAPTGSFTFQVHDSGGTGNGGVDTDPTPNTLTFTVPINHAPSGTDATIAVTHGVLRYLTAADFGFSDTDGHSFTVVTIDTVPTVGKLLLVDATGHADFVTAGQVISIEDINAGHLVYRPMPGATAPGIGSLTFQVHDGGGTANGGVDIDQTPNTLTFNAGNPAAAGVADAQGHVAAFGGFDGTHVAVASNGDRAMPADHGAPIHFAEWQDAKGPALDFTALLPGGHVDLGTLVDTLADNFSASFDPTHAVAGLDGLQQFASHGDFQGSKLLSVDHLL